MAFIRKIKASLVKQDVDDYIGEETYLFYDIETGCIRQHDGTPGGKPACIEGISSPSLGTTIINGQPMITLDDTTRSDKTLSAGEQTLMWSDKRINHLDWLMMGKTSSANSGYVMDFDGTIVYATAHCKDTKGNSKEIRIYIDNVDLGSVGTLTGGTNIEINNNTLNLDFTQGQKIRLRGIDGTGGSVTDTVVKLTVKWRG